MVCEPHTSITEWLGPRKDNFHVWRVKTYTFVGYLSRLSYQAAVIFYQEVGKGVSLSTVKTEIAF